MSKERLTKRKYEEIVSSEKEIPCSNFCNKCSQGSGNCKYVKEMIEKLAEYEDLEEQGLLLRLPVAVGSKVYEIIEETVPKHHCYIAEYEVRDVSAKAVMYADDWYSFDYPNLYFSRAEAEEKLRELEGEQNG